MGLQLNSSEVIECSDKNSYLDNSEELIIHPGPGAFGITRN